MNWSVKPQLARHVQIGMTFHLDQIIEAHLRRIRTGKRPSIEGSFPGPGFWVPIASRPIDADGEGHA